MLVEKNAWMSVFTVAQYFNTISDINDILNNLQSEMIQSNKCKKYIVGEV